jgi:predicted RNA binding protein YcfA (HicA-like mRNA interferase family)
MVGYTTRGPARRDETMPRKIRELIRDLERAGFEDRGGKGSHRNFEHPNGARVTVSGQEGDDAKPYQEREVRRVIKESAPEGEGDES